MKMKFNKVIFSIIFIILTIFPICAYAKEKLTVNNIEVSKGDIVTFEYYMSEVDEPIEAAGAYIIYNHDFLEYVDDSIGFDVLGNAMTNIGEETIYYCAIDVTDGFDFKEEGLVVTASFKVLDNASGATVISNSFDEIFTFENESEDLTSDDYTGRTVIKVNGNLTGEATHSGINAANITDIETSSNAENESNVSLALIIILSVAIIAAAAIIFIFIKKKKFSK